MFLDFFPRLALGNTLPLCCFAPFHVKTSAAFPAPVVPAHLSCPGPVFGLCQWLGLLGPSLLLADPCRGQRGIPLSSHLPGNQYAYCQLCHLFLLLFFTHLYLFILLYQLYHSSTSSFRGPFKGPGLFFCSNLQASLMATAALVSSDLQRYATSWLCFLELGCSWCGTRGW